MLGTDINAKRLGSARAVEHAIFQLGVGVAHFYIIC